MSPERDSWSKASHLAREQEIVHEESTRLLHHDEVRAASVAKHGLPDHIREPNLTKRLALNFAHSRVASSFFRAFWPYEFPYTRSSTMSC